MTSAPADRVVAVAAGQFALVGDHVGAVERIVEAAPAGVGGVQRVAGVADRDHELGAGDGRDLRVHVGRGDAEVRPLRHQIADVGEEGAVGPQVDGLAAVLQVPGVDLGLEGIALGQQRPVARRQFGQDGGEGLPKAIRVDPGARCDLGLNQVIQGLGDLEAAHFHAFDHGLFSGPTPGAAGPVVEGSGCRATGCSALGNPGNVRPSGRWRK